MSLNDLLKQFKATGTNEKVSTGGRTKTVEDHRKYVSKFLNQEIKDLGKNGKCKCTTFVDGIWHIKVVMQSKWLKIDGRNDVQKIVGTKDNVIAFLKGVSIEILKGDLDPQLNKHMEAIRAMKKKANDKKKKG